MSNENQPIERLRIGKIGAVIFANQTQEGKTFYNVQFDRSYRDGDEWKHTKSFGRDDLLVLAKLADQAHSAIVAHQQTSADDLDEVEAA
ncbi:MAG: hypothetical protein R3C53_19035 [Pirellulaceae bacterium]